MRRSVFAASRRDRKKAMKSRAFLNGVEVTRHCQVADDKSGVVLLLKANAEGRHYVDLETREVAKEWLHGRVEIARK